MQHAGFDIVVYVLAFLALAGGLWAMLRLQRKRRQQLLDGLDDPANRGLATSEPKSVGDKKTPSVAIERQQDADASLVAAPVSHERAKPKAPDLLLQAGLASSRASLWGRLSQLLGTTTQLDGAILEAFEEVLLTSDVGVTMTMTLINMLQQQARQQELSQQQVRDLLKQELLRVLTEADHGCPSALDPLLQRQATQQRPAVVLFVGVNGVGKTTTIGKVAHLLTAAQHKVVLAAGDTFRAAAAEQLQIWGTRTGARVVRGAERADPASVMFEAMQSAQKERDDVLLADTAGRLHTNIELMDEIKKVRRALSRLRQDAPDEVWLVVDATTGQNALHQAKQFHQAVGLTGIILTKLDGTAKGGIVIAIAQALKIPVRFIGVGEHATALRPFDAEAFVEALL